MSIYQSSESIQKCFNRMVSKSANKSISMEVTRHFLKTHKKTKKIRYRWINKIISIVLNLNILGHLSTPANHHLRKQLC